MGPLYFLPPVGNDTPPYCRHLGKPTLKTPILSCDPIWSPLSVHSGWKTLQISFYGSSWSESSNPGAISSLCKCLFEAKIATKQSAWTHLLMVMAWQWQWRKNNVNMTEHIISPQAEDEPALGTRIQNGPLDKPTKSVKRRNEQGKKDNLTTCPMNG